MINAIRRTSMVRIPTYAFAEKCINIKTNTSVAFNNDYMRLRLGYFPIYGIDPKLYKLDDVYWKNVNYSDPKRPIHPNEKLVEINVNSHNDTNQIINITSNDINLHIDNTKITKVYDPDNPILIIKLRPEHAFKCTMKGTLGIGKLDARWRASRNTYYEEMDPKTNTYKLTIEGNGQITESDIFIRSCYNIIDRITNIKNELVHRVKTKQLVKAKLMKIVLDGEDFTIGELLNYELQTHSNIIRSAAPKLDHQIESIMLVTESKESVDSPYEAILECIDIVVLKVSHMGKLMYDLENKQVGKKKN